jgi:hypothetical protein
MILKEEDPSTHLKALDETAMGLIPIGLQDENYPASTCSGPVRICARPIIPGPAST